MKDKEFERELMLPIEDLLELQGRGDGRVFNPDGARVDTESLVAFVTDMLMSPFDPSRNPKAVMARVLVSYRLHLDGVGCNPIGWLLRKNHATIIHYYRQMEDALAYPRIFPDHIRYWNAILKKFPI